MRVFLPLLIIIYFLVSCENDDISYAKANDDSIINKYNEKNIKTQFNPNCFIEGPRIVRPNSKVVYKVNDNGQGHNIYLPKYKERDWKFDFSDGIGDHTIEVGPNFKCGEIRVVTSNGCSTNLFVTRENYNCCRFEPIAPEYIRSQFSNPVPSTYRENNKGLNYICINTIDNRLYVPNDICLNYSWSISPEGRQLAFISSSRNEANVIIKRSGRYVVTLTTYDSENKRTEKIILNSENCDGGGGFDGI